MRKGNWENNDIQFPRLIAEAEAVGAFPGRILKALAKEMDLVVEEVGEIIDRAQNEWQRIKDNLFAADTHEDKLSPLFEAMERHGNAEGTETQLGDAEDFLRLAFDSMSPAQQTGFLSSAAVVGFITLEGDGEEKGHA